MFSLTRGHTWPQVSQIARPAHFFFDADDSPLLLFWLEGLLSQSHKGDVPAETS